MSQENSFLHPSKRFRKLEQSTVVTPPLLLALIILQGEENIYPLGSSVWKHTFKPSCNRVQFIVSILERWENDLCCGLATGKHTSWFVYFLTLSEAPYTFFWYLQLYLWYWYLTFKWAGSWTDLVEPLLVLIPLLNLAALPQPFQRKKSSEKASWRAACGAGGGVTCERALKNNIRLPETGRITLIMLKPTTAGDACKASVLPSGSGTWGRADEEFSEKLWF